MRPRRTDRPCSAARALGVLATALVAAAPASPAAAQGLDIEGWLRRPGVKLVAVELYARWCKPCMEAVPRWKALHEKYRDEGLRLIVVSTQDPGGVLVSPGWSPDEVVADDQGTIARALGAGDRLPAAFLWSWDGHLQAQQASVEVIEQRLERWLKTTPRVSVEVRELAASSGIASADLRTLVRERLGDEDKLHVVATQEEQDALDRLKAQSFGARYDERLQCEVGKELPANSLLEVRVSGAAGAATLSLMLLSAERGCLVAASSVPWSVKKSKVAVAEAVTGLVGKLRAPLELPGAVPGPTKEVRTEPTSAARTGSEPTAQKVAVTAPVEPAPKLAVTAGAIQLREQVRFKTARDEILSTSYPVLDELATTLKGRPNVALRVECHSDSTGSEHMNELLTERRAAAIVAYLVKAGVEPARLTSKGYGSAKPIASNATAAGRADNRRCEVHATER